MGTNFVFAYSCAAPTELRERALLHARNLHYSPCLSVGKPLCRDLDSLFAKLW